MRFRDKVFLAVLLPASLLVAAAVGVALVRISRTAEKVSREEFTRTRDVIHAMFRQWVHELDQHDKLFTTPWFEEFVDKANDLKSRKGLVDELQYHFDEIHFRPDFFASGGSDGEAWMTWPTDLKRVRDGKKDLAWIRTEEKATLFRFDERPFLGRRFELQGKGGALVIGREIAGPINLVAKAASLHVALFRKDLPIHSSLDGWTPVPDAAGDVYVNGERFRTDGAKDLELGEMLLLLRPMKAVDDLRRDALLGGVFGLGLAVFIAAFVSVRISRGVSKPVEVLVDAALKIAQGDFKVQVDIPTKDEMGRLGGAFNEMTDGLRKRQEIMEMTLSRDVAEEFLKGTTRGGERKKVTIVFMDIRGYTSGTEGMDPADVVVMLNELMDLLDGAIEEHGGIVNKFLGDGLMAMFGAPKPLEGHPLRAVKAALEMQRRMEAWNEKRRARGLASFYSGIGINTGDVVCGKVGALDRMEYTLIGEEVNLTSRICGKAAPKQVLVTKQTWQHVKDHVQSRPLDPVNVKGLSYPIMVYEVTP